jgi:HPt (histidine-containing phosphotransfer) domain-containing protein
VAEAELPVLDASVLAELSASVGDDRAFVNELIEAYLADAPAHIAAIHEAAAAGNAAALVRPAHTLKSSSAPVGGQQIAARSRRLEFAGREERLDEAATQDDVAGLDADWAAVSAALRQWMDGVPR